MFFQAHSCHTTPLSALEDLQKPLNKWSLKRDKPISLFCRSKRFDPPETIDEENIESDGNFDGGSYDFLVIPDIQTVTKAALIDL